jgi:putative spermidine/putrescine transport system permease protein
LLERGDRVTGAPFRRVVSQVAVWAFVLALVAPLGGTLLFAVATRWVVTVLPEGFTLEAVVKTVEHPRFAETLGRSLGLAVAVVLLDALLVVPSLTALALRRPRWRIVLDVTSVVPFALPGVVVALGLVRFYGWAWPDALNTPWLLAAAHAAGGLPIMYWAVGANLQAIGVVQLYEAGMLLGARPRHILGRVVVPNLLPGVASGGAFVFAFSFTDFAHANLLVGGGWPTFPVWQANIMLLDGHVMAVLSILSFGVLWLATHVVAQWAGRRQLWIVGRAL